MVWWWQKRRQRLQQNGAATRKKLSDENGQINAAYQIDDLETTATPSTAANNNNNVLYAGDENEERGNWSGRFDFLMSAVGYAIGFGNIWRFPYLCFKNGGAVFLIPYAITLLIVALPMVLLEMALGQYSSQGPLTCWQCVPAMKGVGMGMVVLSGLCLIYYNMIVAWSMYYMYSSFRADVPWRTCSNAWNTENCFRIEDEVACERTLKQQNPALEFILHKNHCYNSSAINNNKTFTLIQQAELGFRQCRRLATNGTGSSSISTSDFYYNFTSHACELLNATNNNNATQLENFQHLQHNARNSTLYWQKTLPGAEFWTRNVLTKHLSSGFDNMGSIQPHLVITLALSWVLVFACMARGIKTAGKVVWITVPAPYVFLIVLFVRGLTLEGYKLGLSFYLVPNWHRLGDVQVWLDAAGQVFYSLGIAFGGVLALSSYNRFHNNVLFDAAFIACIDSLTSFFGGMVIFSIMGFLAHSVQRPVGEVIDSGTGLAFIAYPEAVARMPISSLWAIVFFIILISVGLDSQFTMVETVITAIMDQFTTLRRHKTWVVLIVCIISFLIGLPMCTSGGLYVFSLFNDYGCAWSVLFVALFEIITIGWFYGGKRFFRDIRFMCNTKSAWYQMKYYWLTTWYILSPLSIAIILLMSWINYAKPALEGYEFPWYADAIGWAMALLSIVFIPIMAIGKIRSVSNDNEDGTNNSVWKRVKIAFQPSAEWGSAIGKFRVEQEQYNDRKRREKQKGTTTTNAEYDCDDGNNKSIDDLQHGVSMTTIKSSVREN